MRVGTSRADLCKKILRQDHPHACGDKVCVHFIGQVVKGSSPCVWGQVLRGDGWVLECKDHPHACGDKAEHKMVRYVPLGSSPCVWGQATLNITLRANPRIIPMRVGTRNLSTSERIFGLGSSPCVWGQENFTKGLTKWIRIIPMRVGTSNTVFLSGDRNWDHPHACGDKNGCQKYCLDCLGSSPCVWGQVFIFPCLSFPCRIIPMRVGTSQKR